MGLRLTSNVCSPICLLNPKDYPNIGFGRCSFDVLRRPIALDINGNIRLCNHSPVVAGNIYEQSLADILYSDYAYSWEKCKGGCRAASEQYSQTLSVEDPIIRSLQINN
jgi:MoaA/NifB/PqqE/SkfB family radical SAM enzyme